MEHAEQTLARLVEERLKALNTNAFAFERSLNLPEDAIRSILRGGKKAGTALNRAQQICSALGLELYVGPPRDVGQAPPKANAAEYAQVPLHEAWLAAGSGAENGSEKVVEHLAFRRDWLKDIHVSASTACLARVIGDSMEPTLHAGDMILIDSSKNSAPRQRRRTEDRRPAPIFAVIMDGEARVKRLDRHGPDELLLISDNKMHPTEKVHESAVTVIGKVMWWGHTNRE